VWQYACWSGDIPNPGDISVYRNVGKSVIVVRQRDNSLKAFHNSCRHRGRELCGRDTSQGQLRCPYHAFTWGLDGALKWIPAAWDFPQIDRNNFNLPEVRVQEWNGFIFINLDPSAPDLNTYLGKMVDQWKHWDFSNRFRSVTVEKKMNCNWKACLDAFIENFHVFATHPEAAYLVSETAAQYDMYPDEPHFSRFHIFGGFSSENLSPPPAQQEILDAYTSIYMPEVFGKQEGRLSDGESARQALRRLAQKVYGERIGMNVESVPNSELIDGTEYFVFPNFLIWPSIANPLMYRFRPGDTPDTSIWETSLMLPFKGERPASGPTITLGVDEPMRDIAELGYVGPILQQDCDNLKFIQAGMKASAIGFMQTTAYQEARVRHYHKTIDMYLARK
jgi:phenylpropionate dioxygenase-like ring-hydroxylating dioxygenase large terminal subunit